MQKGTIEVHTKNIFPIIKKWLYSDKDIFIRELVVNGCDAITKLKKLQSIGQAAADDAPFRIDVACDKDKKTITISDNGLGMTQDEVVKYITQLAFSGAEEFLEKYQETDEKNQIIGHFGLGFYSAFMVADKVELETKSYTDAPAVLWTCDGGTEYEMGPSSRTQRGTTITLHVSEGETEFVEPYRLTSVLLKYCGFLPYPIHMDGKDEPLNDTNPLWNRAPADCTDEEYKALYHRIFSDMNDPLFWIHLNVDFPFALKGILYFPKLTHEFESAMGQIKLYNNQVFVADNIKEAIPEFLMLLKGVLDCPELPLNVSRSSLQNDGYVSKISTHITKKVADKLLSLQKEERDSFDKYWDDISAFIEYGCMRDDKFYEKCKPILQARTIQGEFVTLVDYAAGHDNAITYANSPHQQAQYIKMAKENGTDAILLPHPIDIHLISFLEDREGWKFTRVDTIPQDTQDNEELIALFRSALGDSQLKVTTSAMKTTLPAMIVEDEQTRRMADITRMFGQGIAPQVLTLVLNTDSAVIQALPAMTDTDRQTMLCKQIFDIARLCHTPLGTEDMTAFVDRNVELMNLLIG